MDKFIKLTLSTDESVVVNTDSIACVYPTSGCEYTRAKIFISNTQMEDPIFVKEPVEEILALLTGDRKYFAEKAREAKRLEKEQKLVKVVEDGCTPIVDLQPSTGNVTSCHSSSITAGENGVITICGGNSNQCIQVGSAVTSDIVARWPYGAVVSCDKSIISAITSNTVDTVKDK